MKKKSLKDLFFKFFSKNEQLLEDKGKYIDWTYFQKHVSNELNKIKVKTFFAYRNAWFNIEYNKSFSDYVNLEGLEPYSRIEITKYSSLGPQSVDLNKLITPFIKNSEKLVQKYDYKEISSIIYGGTLDPKDVVKIYKNRRLYRWYSIIYKITQIKNTADQVKNNGYFIIGYLTTTIENRWYHYKQDALNDHQSQNIHKLIRELSKSGIKIDDAFKWEILEICWTDSKTRDRENYWIAYFNEKNPSKLLNIYKGGGGGYRISIPKALLIPFIAKGLWQSDMLKEIKEQNKINISIWSLYNRINGYFPAQNNITSIQVARKEILKPILKYLIKHGYSSEYLAKNVFYKSRKTISNWCQEFWNKTFEKKRAELLKEFLEKLIIQGLEYREVDENVKGMPWSTISNYITKLWGGLKYAREFLMKPLIAKTLIEDYDYNQIIEILNMDNIDRLRKFLSIFWKIPSNSKGDWTHIERFIEYIKTYGLNKEEIMSINYDQLFN
ncbi:MAG: hypothetical protein ACFFDH_04535 [Promethearchaeota archaeon]